MSKPVIDSDGTKRWYNEQGKRHREDGPAIVYPDGSKQWYLNGKRHREDGPAYEGFTGSKSWYLNGKKYTEEEFALIQFMNGVNIYA